MCVWILSQHQSSYENTRLLNCFSAADITAQLMEPDDFDIIVNRHQHRSIRYRGTSIRMPSLVLTRTGAGTNYFSSAVMRQLEQFSVPTVNSSTAINNVRDKLLAHQLLAQSNIPTPRTMLVKFPVSSAVVEQEIGFPCVVKVVQGSYGKGVHLCHSRALFEDLMDLVETLSVKKTMIVQEFIDAKAGSDLRVWVVGDQVIGAMKRTGPEGDFRANITGGGTGEAWPVTAEIQQLCLSTARVVGLEIAGIDLLFDHQGYRVCEANSAPGFEGMEKYVGIDVAMAIVQHVQRRLDL